MKFSTTTATLLASTAMAVHGVNVVIIQPDDMQYYNDWNPPPYLPWSNNYPGKDFPGSPGSTLPNINKLRDRGLDMTQAYAAAPKCGTSRYSTVTGRYASRSSTGRNTASQATPPTNPAATTIPNTKLQDVAPAKVPDGSDCSVGNIAQVFKKNGYQTGMVGKWHLTKVRGGSVANIVTEVQGCGEFSPAYGCCPA